LAARFEVNERVQLEKVCVDTNLQWSRIGNVWHNAGARSMIYTMAAPLRWGVPDSVVKCRKSPPVIHRSA
jgi:hypothetical protein